MEKKYLISKGHINKYIFFAVTAGVCKCFVTIMVYKFENYAKYNDHPLLMGFNAGIGMSLSIIPLIIIKTKSHRDKKHNKLNLTSNLTKGTKSISSIVHLNYLEKYDKKKLRTQKYLILLACAFLDFSNKFLTFFLKKFVINNIWFFNIIFISIFDYFILKSKLYKHQYISCIIIVILGIAGTTVGFLKEKENIYIKILLGIFLKLIYSLSIVLAKFLMDHRSCSPYDVTFYEGIFILIVNSILLGIFTNIPIKDENRQLEKILVLTEYEGKKYIDHFIAAFENMKVGEVFLFILSAIGRLISNLFGYIIVKHYTSSHIILVLMIGEIGLVFKKEQGWREIVQFILFFLALFMLLIFTEIIEINACDLEKNTRKNIEIRERMEEEDDDDDEDYDMNGNIIHHKKERITKIEIDGVVVDFSGEGGLNENEQNGRISDASENNYAIN